MIQKAKKLPLIYSLLLSHVGYGPLVLHSQHSYLPQLLLFGLFQNLFLPLRRKSGHHLLLEGLVLPGLDLYRVIVLFLNL